MKLQIILGNQSQFKSKPFEYDADSYDQDIIRTKVSNLLKKHFGHANYMGVTPYQASEFNRDFKISYGHKISSGISVVGTTTLEIKKV